MVREAKILYQNVWVVFDKDDFQDFDTAIAEATDKGYRVAWSNQAFEYWLYLHFYYSDSALHRHEWNKKLDEIFAEYGLGNGEYAKNYEDIYNMVDTYGGVATAIKNAKRRIASFDVKRDKPSEYDPGTMVYELVEELKIFEPNALVYKKNSTSTIYAPGFIEDIDNMENLKEVIIVGCCTDICVLNLAIPLQNYFDEKTTAFYYSGL